MSEATHTVALRLRDFIPTMRNVIAQIVVEEGPLARHAPSADAAEFMKLYVKVVAGVELLYRYDAVLLKDLADKPVLFRDMQSLYTNQRELATLLQRFEGKDAETIAKLLQDKQIMERLSELVAQTEKELNEILRK